MELTEYLGRNLQLRHRLCGTACCREDNKNNNGQHEHQFPTKNVAELSKYHNDSCKVRIRSIK